MHIGTSYSQTEYYKFCDFVKFENKEKSIKKNKGNVFTKEEDSFFYISDSIIGFSIYNIELIKKNVDHSICRLSINENFYNYEKKINDIIIVFYQDSIVIRVVGRYNNLLQKRVLNKDYYPLNYISYNLEDNSFGQTIYKYDTIYNNSIKSKVYCEYTDSLRQSIAGESYDLYYKINPKFKYHFLFSQCYFLNYLPFGIYEPIANNFESYGYYSNFVSLLGLYNNDRTSNKVKLFVDVKKEKYQLEYKNNIIDHFNHFHYLYYKPLYEINNNTPKYFW
jgi:hypothetical protein